MSIDRVREYLADKGAADRILEFEVSSATVELAALAVGVEGARIAKTLSFHVGEDVVLVVCAGDARINNRAFKDRFAVKKVKMLSHDEAEELVGHAVGGVCPFAVNPGVQVYLDESLRRFDTVFPACGSSNSAIEVSPDELEQLCEADGWVDVCTLPSAPVPATTVVTTALISCVLLGCLLFAGCEREEPVAVTHEPTPTFTELSDAEPTPEQIAARQAREEEAARQAAEAARQQRLAELWDELDVQRDMRDNLDHGPKGAEYQKYIVLHDTEGSSSGSSVISWWAGNGNQVAAHFVIDKDGTIWQCVEIDRIAHHAGFGDAGHNDYYGVADESRDDKAGTKPIGSWAPDYGMNSYSVGIEMVHVGDGSGYPEAQLEALDKLIEYIDLYYGFESEIIDHKMWRSGNSDTSAQFAGYLENYRDHRTHD